ncbi:MAG TPA: hypothetical protein VH560_04665 [Polyangia bacterium]|nr:hypothetical protein [Polyangia bacterium]
MMRRGLWLAVLLCGCAARPTPEASSPPRVKDSIPERAAALRGADGRLKLDDEDQRFGIEAAKARKDQQREQRDPSPTTAVIHMPPPNDSGVFVPHDASAGNQK